MKHRLLSAGSLFCCALVASAVPAPLPQGVRKARAPQFSPGVQALVAASTDVIIADVADTNPHKAMEGARDTVQLKVARRLLASLAGGEMVSVYYHLHWLD